MRTAFDFRNMLLPRLVLKDLPELEIFIIRAG